jgi:hypothetical protein
VGDGGGVRRGGGVGRIDEVGCGLGVGAHLPEQGVGVGVGVGVAVGVGVNVGVGEAVAVAVGVGAMPQTTSVSTLAIVVEPSYPPAAISRLLPIAALDGNDRPIFKLGELVQVLVAGL